MTPNLVYCKSGYVPPVPHVGKLPGDEWGVFDRHGELTHRVSTQSLALAWSRLMPISEDDA